MREIKRYLSMDELCENDYEDMADLAEIFQHDAVAYEGFDSNGKPDPSREIWRWKRNELMHHFQEECEFHTPPQWHGVSQNIIHSGAVDLNQLAIAHHRGKFTTEEYMKFHMQIGYSLCGFSEIFGQHEASEFPSLRATAKPIPEDHNGEEYIETVIDYMRRIHKGKILKL